MLDYIDLLVEYKLGSEQREKYYKDKVYRWREEAHNIDLEIYEEMKDKLDYNKNKFFLKDILRGQEILERDKNDKLL